MAFIRRGYDPNHRFSCYGFFLFDRPPTVSEIVQAAGWGGNRNIRNREIRRLVGRSPAARLVKNWPVVADPGQIVADSTFLAKGTGRGMGKIVYVRIDKS